MKRMVAGCHILDELLLRIGQDGSPAGDETEFQPLPAVFYRNGDALIQGVLRGKALNPDRIEIAHGDQVHQRRPPVHIEDAGGIVQIGLVILCGDIVDKVLILPDVAHESIVPQIL